MSKFIYLKDKQLGFFKAGGVKLWEDAVPFIESVLHEITIENVALQEGPLQLALQRYTEAIAVERGKPKPQYGGIGVMIDENKGINTVFKLDGKASEGLRVAALNDGIVVIGSGKQIPKIEEHLGNLLDKHIAEHSFNLPEVVSVLKRGILEQISRCGASAYQKLGISPVIATSQLEKKHFTMPGFEIKGSTFSTNAPRRDYHYSYKRIKNKAAKTL
ncbi:hypothetical protein [Paenibacillus maysiensis]|uniref:hypothetical protein n=1 Tax=Paenibacillus maysiensis TaxID=1155954 RepID=UPI0004729260|nr:hypothetical protein [Paenibacillus maysiensis]